METFAFKVFHFRSLSRIYGRWRIFVDHSLRFWFSLYLLLLLLLLLWIITWSRSFNAFLIYSYGLRCNRRRWSNNNTTSWLLPSCFLFNSISSWLINNMCHVWQFLLPLLVFLGYLSCWTNWMAIGLLLNSSWPSKLSFFNKHYASISSFRWLYIHSLLSTFRCVANAQHFTFSLQSINFSV